jgi:hypothetical protein
MSNIDSVIEKVRKLLALATSSNANEAATAAAVANKLIDEYRLSECDLEINEGGSSEPIEEDADYIYQSGKITRWKASLVRVLTTHYGVAYWNDISFETKRQVSRYRMVGKRSDMGIVRYMFAWLSTECQRLSALEAKGMGRVFVASYCEGFVSGIAEQLKVSRVAVQAQATSASIIKIDAREQEAKDEMHRLHTNLKKKNSYSHSQRDRMAFDAGQFRGKNVHLGGSIGSGGTKLLSK